MMRTTRSIPYLPLLVLILLLSTVPFIFFGLRYIDIGWNLTKGWMMVEHPGAAQWELTWLSSMLTGLWMKLGWTTLLWSRVGFVLLSVLTFTLLYGLLRFRYEQRESVLGVIPAFMIFAGGYDQLIPNYYTIPGIFGLGSLLCFFIGLRSTKPMRQWITSIMSGVLFALLIQARFPSILLIVLFPVLILMARHHRERLPGAGWHLLFGFLAGLAIGTAALAGVMQGIGMLDHIINGISGTLRDTATYSGRENIHHPVRLLTDTIVRYGTLITFGLFGIGAAWFLQRLKGRSTLDGSEWWSRVILGSVALVTAYLSIREIGQFPPSIGMVTLLFLYIFWKSWNEGDIVYRLLGVTAVAYLLFMNAGSSNPKVSSTKYTAIIVMSMGLLEGYRRVRVGQIPTRFVALLIIINVLSLWGTTRIGLELPWKGEEYYSLSRLAGTADEPERVHDIETVVTALHSVGLVPGDTLLAYVDSPIMNFITETTPYLTNSWVSNFYVGMPTLPQVQDIIAARRKEGHLPKFIVRTIGRPALPGGEAKKILWLDSVWGAEGYDSIPAGKDYVVLVRPDLVGTSVGH